MRSAHVIMSLLQLTKDERAHNRQSYWLLLATIVLLPSFAFVWSNMPSMMTKVAFGGISVLCTLILFAVATIRAQRLVLPRVLILVVVWLVPIAYGISTLFAGSRTASMYGDQLSMDSLVFLLIGASLLTVSALVSSTQKRALGVYLAFISAAVLLSVLELILFFAREWVASTGAILPSLSLLGTLNDLAVFYGLIVIFVLLSSILLPITRVVETLLWAVLVIALYFVAVVNLTVLWWILGLFALGTLVYSVTVALASGEGRASISFPSLAVVVVCALFLFGPASVTGALANWAQVGELDVRPSWQSTVSIGRTALAGQSIIGAGPGSFERLWSLHMPEGISQTEFWQTNFKYGIGYIPTSVISVGLLGALAWLVFIGVFLVQGVRSLVLVRGRGTHDVANYIRVTAFLAALYLWIVACTQVPSPTLVLFAFLMTGIFAAALSFGRDTLPSFSIVFRDNARIGFLATFVLMIITLAGIGGVYGISSRFVAEKQYQDAIRTVSIAGDLDTSEALTQRALNLHPSDQYYRLLSNIDMVRLQSLLQEGRPPEEIRQGVQDLLARAIGNAQKATELDNTNYQNWINLGTIYQNIVPIGIEGADQSAADALQKALELRPRTPEVHLALATIERGRGDNVLARTHVEQAISLRNRYTEAIFFLAQIQLEENDTENAIRSVQAISIIEPNNPVAYFQLGLLHYGTEDFMSAVQSLERATTLAPEYANARYFLGLAYWRLGDMARAQTEFERVQATNPDNAEVRSIISNLRAGKAPFEPPTTAGADVQNLDGLPLAESEPTATSSEQSLPGDVAP